MTAASSASLDWRSQPAPAWKLPQIGNHPIPGQRYTSREFFAREWEQMWTTVWLLLGRESEIPQAGDWQMEEVVCASTSRAACACPTTGRPTSGQEAGIRRYHEVIDEYLDSKRPARARA